MKPSTKKIFGDMIHRKVRTILTLLGIAIGVMGLSAINLATSQLSSSLAFISNTAVQPDIQFTTTATNASFASVLQQQPNVKIVQSEISVSTRWAIPSGHYSINVVGLANFQDVQVNKFELVEGNLPGPHQIVLESSDRAIAPIHVGDHISIDTPGATQQLTVSGFVRTEGRPSSLLLDRALGYMAQSDVASLFHISGVNSFLVRLVDHNQTDASTKALSRIFVTHHILIEGLVTGYYNQVSSTVNGVMSTIQVLSIIAFLLSVFLVLGTVTTLVTEQFRIIGTMKALGAQRGTVMKHYLGLVMAYGFVGTCIGLALGIAGGYYLVSYLGNLLTLDIGSLDISPLLLLESALIGIVIPVIAAVIPVFIGTRITVRQALSNYGLDAGSAGRGAGWVRFTRSISGFFPQTIQFGMRNLFRKRWRTVLTLCTLVIAGIAFLSVQITSYSFTTFLGQVFNIYHFDIVVSVPEPQPYARLQQIIAKVPGVKRTENLSWSYVTTRWGQAFLTGVQPDTQLYRKQLLAGRWFTSNDQDDVLLSKDAAQKSGLKIGDTISFHDSLHSANWHIIGIVKDYNGIGQNNLGVILAPIALTNAFHQLPADYSQTVMIQATSSNQNEVNALATRVDTAMSAAGLLPSESTAQQEILQNETRYNVVYALLYFVALIIALVGAIGLFNTLAMSVFERQREIGILRSMGARARNILQVFWTEALCLGLLSWLIALVLGVPAAHGFVLLLGRLLLPVPFAFNPPSLVWMLIFILGVASLASAIPVFGSVRLKAVQVLHYE
jgi:putative ABC transport system permease protein